MAAMTPNWLRGLKSALLGPRRVSGAGSARTARLGVESLEDRAVPAVHTWTDGGLTNNWSDAGNWAGGVPTTGEVGGTVVVFPTSDPTCTQNIAGLVVDRIDFTSTGNSISLAVPLGLNGSVSSNQITSTGLNTISGSTLNLSGATAFLSIGAGVTTIGSAITGAQGIRKFGAGTLNLTTAVGNTYTGTTTVADGVLNLGTTTGDAGVSAAVVVGDGLGAAGSAVLRLPNVTELPDTASVTVGTDGLVDVLATGAEDITTLNVNGGQVALAAGGIFQIQSGGTVTANGASGSQITGGGSFRLQSGAVAFDVADGGAGTDLLVAASITQLGAAGLTKTGAGTLTLSGWNTYTGTTTVGAGTLEVTNGVSGPVSVAGGTLAGGGTVGAITATGGMVAPGAGGAPQTLSTGNVALGGVTFAPAVAGSTSDRLSVTGTVNLSGATLTPTAVGAVPATASYTLISNDGSDPITGTFNGLPQAAIVRVGGQPFVLSYTGGDGNDVTLTPPLYSDAFMFGDFLILTGPSFSGGFTFFRMPTGTTALFSDLTGDGWGDVILFTPNLAVVVDGATGRFVALASDVSGDGVRDLQVFNLDGTTTTTDGRTGVKITA